MSNSALLKSSLAKKYWMALTGLFLCSFLVVHLIGNLQLLYTDDGEAFNQYAKFMTTFPLIKIVSYLLYFSILFHSVDGILLVIKNKKARPVNYKHNKPGVNSSFSSRMMGLLGSLILVFIVTHMAQFWGVMHFGEIGTKTYDGETVKDLYTLVVNTYTEGTMGIVWVAAYVFAQAVLGFHLWHGFQSAFQSLGMRHAKYTPLIKGVGAAFAVLVPLAFAVIPVWIYLCS